MMRTYPPILILNPTQLSHYTLYDHVDIDENKGLAKVATMSATFMNFVALYYVARIQELQT